ncbi:MAG: nucleotidyltransferase family protein [Pseudomonadota bacterium]
MTNAAESMFQSPELRCLAELIRPAEDATPKKPPRGFASLDWPTFAELAAYHRVEALVATSISNHKDWDMPEDWRRHFLQRQKVLARNTLRNAANTTRLCRFLTDSDVPFLLIKGVAVSQKFYADSEIRQAIDVDIWISPNDVSMVIERLKVDGYEIVHPDFDLTPHRLRALQRMVNEITIVHRDHRVSLDLHWRLNVNPYFMDWAFDDVYARSERLALNGLSVPVLSELDQLIYFHAHGAKHAWFRLKWLADLYRIDRLVSAETKAKLLTAAKTNKFEIMVSSGDWLLSSASGKTEPNSTVPVYIQRYIAKQIGSKISYNSLTVSNVSKVFAEFRYKLGLKRDLRYKLSTVLHYCLNMNDIPLLNLSERFFPVYAITGPIFGVARAIGRSLDALLSRPQNTPQPSLTDNKED